MKTIEAFKLLDNNIKRTLNIMLLVFLNQNENSIKATLNLIN